MEPPNDRIILINIEEEMKSSYIDYSMSVIVGRALPDVRDGLKPVHRRVLYSMSELGLSPGSSYKKSARIVGECFVAGTLVLTEQGLVPIEQVERGDCVFTQSGRAPVTELFEMPVRDLLKITLENGVSVMVTPAQPVKVLTPTLEYQWKTAKDLTPADYVVVRASYPDNLPYVPLPDWQGRPICLNEDLAYLIGQFLSDGWISVASGRFCFYSTERAIIERLQAILTRVFGYESRIEDKSYPYTGPSTNGENSKRSAYQVRIHSSALNEYLSSTFQIEPTTGAATKYIPAPFFRSPKPVLAALLSGLIDGDGSVHVQRNVINYGTISEALADGIQLLLQHLGVLTHRFTQAPTDGVINGRSMKSKHPLFALEATGRYAQQLAQMLTLAHEQKRQRLQRILAARLKVTKVDRVPYAAATLFKELSDHHLGGGWYRDTQGHSFRQGIAYATGTKIRYSRRLWRSSLGRTPLVDGGISAKLKRIGSRRAPFVQDVLDHDLYFLKVARIEAAPAQKTYDLQVDGPHEFIANGIVSHNCLGKFHPHGDSSVYDTMVRMAQHFSLRYPLVDGQGNFGSVDGDSAAAMRYTEARMTRLAEEMLRDLNQDTVDFQENFDASLEEPTVLPAAVPNLLVNGSDGIAVGMATKIPPHNLGEVVDAVIAYIDNPAIDTLALMEHLPGPDFPTGGIIYGHTGVQSAYHTGRGRVIMRARMHEEEIRAGRFALVITEIPYQVNKSTLIEKIAYLVREKRIDGISDMRDESDRDGMRIVLELKKDAMSLVVQNQLYKFSQCQQTFGVNMVALVNGRPRVLTLKDAIRHYVDHRHVVVTRRTRYQLRKAEERAHILEGLLIALDHLDTVITIIRHSDDTDEARRNLVAGVYPSRLTPDQLQRLGLPPKPPIEHALRQEAQLNAAQQNLWLTEAQTDAILALRLSRLTGLERQKIDAEYRDLIQEIERLRSILGNQQLRMQIIKDELRALQDKYADERRTEIDYAGGEDIIIEDLIEDEQVVVTISHQGLIKRTSTSEYRKQGRGGVGMRGGGLRDDDYLEHLFVSFNHDYLLFFTDHGRCYWLRVYEIPVGSRTAKGRSIRNLIEIAPEDRIRAVQAVSKANFRDQDFLNDHYVLMVTRKGQVKKTPLEAFSRPRVDGIIAIDIVEGDELLEAHLTGGDAYVILASSSGLSIRFHERDARSMGRNTRGVRGIRLGPGEQVVGMVVIASGEDRDVLAISANGYGKRTLLEGYRVQSRGGKGIITLKTTAKTGSLVSIKGVLESDDLMIITENGVLIRTHVDGISTLGRNTQGVRLIRLKDGDAIADVTRVVSENGQDAQEGAMSDAPVEGSAAEAA